MLNAMVFIVGALAVFGIAALVVAHKFYRIRDGRKS